jgi:hypothetical protein
VVYVTLADKIKKNAKNAVKKPELKITFWSNSNKIYLKATGFQSMDWRNRVQWRTFLNITKLKWRAFVA